MKRAICLLAGMTMLAGVATAGPATTGDVDIFFSTDNTIGFMERQAPEVPTTVGATETVYIWANLDLYDYRTWNGVGLRFATSGATIVGGGLYNANMGGSGEKGQPGKQFRWQNGAVGDGDPFNPIPISATDGDLIGAAVTAPGFQLLALGADARNGDFAVGPAPVLGDDLAYSNFAGDGTWTGSYLLGWLDVQVDQIGGTINLGVSDELITRAGDAAAPWATVAFGLNGALDGRVVGNGLNNPTPDVTFTPEPASLLLVALAGLAIRRR